MNAADLNKQEETDVADDEEHIEVTIDSRTGAVVANRNSDLDVVGVDNEGHADGQQLSFRSRNIPNKTSQKSRFSNL